MRRVLAGVLWAFLILPGAAKAWTILNPTGGQTPCHEYITLGALDMIDAPWSSTEDAQIAELIGRMADVVEMEGVPQDDETQAFLDQFQRDYPMPEGLSEAEIYVIASFVAGVRDPDTSGFALTVSNELREVHLDDDDQPRHSLRRTLDDGVEGNMEAILAAQALVRDIVGQSSRLWRGEDEGQIQARWTLRFYGQIDPVVYGPAYKLGEAAHTLQDAYTHTLRNESGQITTVLNYLDPIHNHEGYEQRRDGLTHSDRLDECDPISPRDEQRVAWAREATVQLFTAAEVVFLADSPDPEARMEAVDGVLDTVYAYESDCTIDDKYCDSPDYDTALESLSTPFFPGCACDASGGPMGPGGLVVLALVGGLGLVTRRRRAG